MPHFAPEKVILFSSLARSEGRWDVDADILVVMPLRGDIWKKLARSASFAEASFRSTV